MADVVAATDNSHAKGLIALSNVGDGTFVDLWADPVSHRLLVDLAGGGSGTVTSVSVISANGFAGTVATATTTPAITLSTTITGLLKGNGTAISAAVGDTDFQNPITLTTTGTSGAATFIGDTLNIPNYASSSGLIIGTTTITTGTSTRVLFDNAGVLGEYVVSGSGNVAMTTSPSFTTPTLGVASATSINKVTITAPATSATLTIANGKTLTANNSITIAGTDATTMTFPTTSATIARIDAGQTFTGTNAFGVITATTLNGNTFTTGTYTLTGTAAKTFNFTNSLTLSGTDSTTMTFPTTSATIARTDAAQTFTGTQTFAQVIETANAITATTNAATIPVTSAHNIVTNSSAATLTITLTTASAVNMQTCVVQILDFSAVAETITWVNTENSTQSVPTTSNGSTTLPLTVGFMYNSATSKWRCIAVA